MEKIWKIIDLINWGKDYFESKSIESPRLNMEILLCHALNMERVSLYTKYDLPLNPNELNIIRALVIRRAKREPLQYIVGNQAFMNLDIKVTSDVLIPRPETEELVELIVKNHKDKGKIKILDIGTGSGCIALSLAKLLPESNVVGIDVSDKALAIAEYNKKFNAIENVSFEKIDFLKNCNFLTNYDVLVSNPPYISLREYEGSPEKELFFEPRKALTDESDGLSFYKKFSEHFADMLNNNGSFYLEIAYNQSKQISDIFEKNYDIKFHKDFSGIIRMVEGNIKV